MTQWTLASRAAKMNSSAIREILKLTDRPGIISMAGGLPSPQTFPISAFQAACNTVLERDGAAALQYSTTEGLPALRQAVADFLPWDVDPEQVLIVSGSQQALDLIGKIFLDKDSRLLVERPTYLGALQAFAPMEPIAVGVASDDQGMLVDDFAAQAGSGADKARFAYVLPNFQNPTGVTQSLERRRELIAVAHELDLLIVEDNPYGLLTIEGEPLPALRSMDDERVIYLGSFSKTFAPGFRVGWALAPHAVREKLTLAQESATLAPPVFSQFAISTYLHQFDWRAQIVAYRDMYRGRRDAMLRGLTENMPPGCTWTHPTGGFFVWLTMPEGLDSQSMLPRAVSARVAYVPGTAFYADGLGSRNMRLSFCFPSEERIVEGTRRLGEVIHDELDMLRTFGIDAGTVEAVHRDLTAGPAPDIT